MKSLCILTVFFHLLSKPVQPFSPRPQMRSLVHSTSVASSVSDQFENVNAKAGTVVDRRVALVRASFFLGGLVSASPALALDMDAFMNSEIASDNANCDPKKDPKCIPKLTKDESLCKYGASGNARGEACKRVKAAGGTLPGQTKEKSLGGAYAM